MKGESTAGTVKGSWMCAAQGRPAQGRPAQGRPAQGRPAQGRPAQWRPAQGRPAQGCPARPDTLVWVNVLLYICQGGDYIVRCCNNHKLSVQIRCYSNFVIF
jgi:hypothetical protein